MHFAPISFLPPTPRRSAPFELSMSLRRTTCQLPPPSRWADRFLRRQALLPRRSRTYTTSAPASAYTHTFGQPTHETHPHLLRAGELTPHITAAEYHARRCALLSRLPRRAIAIVAAADTVFRSGNVFFPFHQDPDFAYLTGWLEGESVAVVSRDGDGDEELCFRLWVREKDEKAEMWDGARSGVLAAREVWNADLVGDISKNVRGMLEGVVQGASEVYTDLLQVEGKQGVLSRFLRGRKPSSAASSKAVAELAEVVPASKVRALRPIMNELRVFKSDAEVRCMRAAGRASGLAHTDVMSRSFGTEREMHAFLNWRQVHHGCEGSAFEPVVAGGRNAMGIHYVRNDDVLRDGEMVLVDGGGKHGGYVADITRTFPVDGRFTAAQRDLYTAVLNVQKTCVALCRGSAMVSLDKLHEIAEEQLKDQLKGIGFDVSEAKAVERLFPHHLSHYVGMDVHDCIGYSRKTVLREGHCVTVEPGVYVPDEERWPKHFRGMGIRIEDSVAVREDETVVLTKEAVKEIEEIEALRS